MPRSPVVKFSGRPASNVVGFAFKALELSSNRWAIGNAPVTANQSCVVHLTF